MPLIVRSVEEALRLVESFDGDPSQLFLGVPESLLDPLGLNMALVTDRALARGWQPNGYSQEKGYRVFRYRYPPKGHDEVVSAYLNAMMAPDATTARVVQALRAQGCADDDVQRVIIFAPLAFGRQFLGDIVTFPPEYIVLSADGELVFRGRLDEEPLFQLCCKVAESPHVRNSIGALMESIARGSSEVRAVTDAMRAGSEPKHLSLAPPLFFKEQATPQGIARAQEIIRKEVGAPTGRTPSWK